MPWNNSVVGSLWGFPPSGEIVSQKASFDILDINSSWVDLTLTLSWADFHSSQEVLFIELLRSWKSPIQSNFPPTPFGIYKDFSHSWLLPKDATERDFSCSLRRMQWLRMFQHHKATSPCQLCCFTALHPDFWVGSSYLPSVHTQ